MRVSVIIPTYNEEEGISGLIDDLQRYGGEALEEIIVVDAPSPDRTAQRAGQAGAQVIVSAQPGRAAQMNAGARIARGDVLYFVHADVRIHPDYVQDIQQALAEGYRMGCYRYQFDSPRLILKLNTFFQRFDRIWARGGDQTLFIPKGTFEELGGYCGASGDGRLRVYHPGTIVAFDDETDMRGVAKAPPAFGAAESCGKCFPCRIGLRRAHEDVR